ncbi:MAG TPA: hypothetical protein VGB82_25230 [Alphaproteobacteria bacterium]
MIRCRNTAAALLAAWAVAGLATVARAGDEIQVYNADINEPGQWSLQLHNNYVISGKNKPDFPGGMVPQGSLNGTPELARGMTEWWELGMYAPYAVTRHGNPESGGVKLRTLFVSPHAEERTFFYGVNFELGYAPPLFSEHRWNVEIRPIIGVRVKPIEFIVNPIIDTSLDRDNRTVGFLPAARLAYILSDAWAVGFENYSDFGRVDRIQRSQQQQILYLVTDYTGEPVDVNFGIGRGYTSASDNWVVKMILGKQF